METTISVGCVYKNHKRPQINDLLAKLLTIVQIDDLFPVLYKYYLDRDGLKDIEKKDGLIDDLTNHYYGQLFFNTTFLGLNLNVVLTV